MLIRTPDDPPPQIYRAAAVVTSIALTGIVVLKVWIAVDLVQAIDHPGREARKNGTR
jgi:hypothetical protein